MKKLTIKFILISLILSLSIVCGNVFVNNKQSSPTLKINFYGYDDSYITETSENHLVSIDLTNDVTGSIPTRYDLRDYIEIKVENQKNYGICYAFGSLTMLETYLALHYNEYYDFSEIHMATAKYVENGTMIYDPIGNLVDNNVDFDSTYGGGNFFNFYDYCLKGSGPVLEIEMPMSTFYAEINVEDVENQAETYFNTYKSEFSNLVTVNQFVSFLDGSSLNAENKLVNRNKIKEHIMTNGSCSASIYSSSMSTHNNTQYLNSVNASSNHMISIIGWDDTYKPHGWANAGAYLCLNSWGEDKFGGVFYVSYDDVNIESDVYGVSSATLNSNNNIVSNYQSFLKNSSTLSRTSSWNVNSTGNSVIATVTDVSTKLDSYINEISFSAYYPTTKTPEIYLGFVDHPTTKSNYYLSDEVVNSAYPTGKVNISSYSNITNNSSYLLGDTLFNVKLSTPIKITGKYAVLIIKTQSMFKLHGLESTANTNPLLNTYWNSNMSRIISSENTSLLMLTSFTTSKDMYVQTNSTGKLTNQNLLKTNKGYTYNNSTNLNNTIAINVENPTHSLTTSEVQVYSITSSLNALTKNYVTSNFNIFKEESKISLELTNNISLGTYIVKFMIGAEDFYKAFTVVENTTHKPNHSITYNLNGGENHSLNIAEYNESLTEIKFYHPSRLGYEFCGWYTDEALSTKLNGIDYTNIYGDFTSYNENLQTNIVLYAKWQLKTPTILTQPTGLTKTYTGSAFTISCLGSHELGEVSYQWFKNGNAVKDQTSNTLSLTNASDSGRYTCKISYAGAYTITNEVKVTINKATYNIYWKSPSEFVYSNSTKSVDIQNNYPDLTYTLTNNIFKNAGDYSASVQFTNWDKDNYNTPVLNDLNWTIKKAEIKINIHDVSVNSQEEFTNFRNYSYDLIGTIYDDYNLTIYFDTINTENDYIKIIEAVYMSNPNYNVTTNTAYIKIAKQTISTEVNNTIFSIFNEQGFVTDANLSVTPVNQQDLSISTQKLIEDNELIVYGVYDIEVSDNTLTSTNTISVNLSKDMAEKNLKVYKITENGMELLNSSIVNNTLTFTTNGLGQFIIVEAPKEENIMPVLISIGIILLGTLMCCFIIFRIKKNRNKKYYSSIDYIPH